MYILISAGMVKSPKLQYHSGFLAQTQWNNLLILIYIEDFWHILNVNQNKPHRNLKWIRKRQSADSRGLLVLKSQCAALLFCESKIFDSQKSSAAHL